MDFTLASFTISQVYTTAYLYNDHQLDQMTSLTPAKRAREDEGDDHRPHDEPIILINDSNRLDQPHDADLLFISSDGVTFKTHSYHIKSVR